MSCAGHGATVVWDLGLAGFFVQAARARKTRAIEERNFFMIEVLS